jgi:hypothetical protein
MSVALIALSGFAVMAPSAHAAGVNYAACAVNPSQILSLSHVPAGAVKIINIHYKVTWDEDSGFAGYWAIDNYTHTVKVWQVSPGSFYAIAQFNGTWHTYKGGALSPQLGDQEFLSGHGPFSGGINFTFTGTFNPTLSVSGKIGPYNYGGSVADVLLGKYSNGQTGPTAVFDWMSAYFTGFSVTSEYFGFGYNWNPGAQTWCNFDASDGGSTGDIVT